MLTIKVIGDNLSTVNLPDKRLERENERLLTIRQGIQHLFRDVMLEIPGHEIVVIWDEKNLILEYESKTISKKMISQILYQVHGARL
jgi:hypothetical protein